MGDVDHGSMMSDEAHAVQSICRLLDASPTQRTIAHMFLRSSRIVALALTVLAFSGCANYQQVFAPARPAPGTVVNWMGRPFDEVRAYCYDYTKGFSPTFLDLNTGAMHRGVMDPRGVRLSADQVNRLVPLVTTSFEARDRTACYAPHHAFVFFAKGKPVAVFEMCFGCNRHRSYPSGAPEYIDRTGLWTLTGELGLPLGEGNKFYTETCDRCRVR
jgi:hypothetical protein